VVDDNIHSTSLLPRQFATVVVEACSYCNEQDRRPVYVHIAAIGSNMAGLLTTMLLRKVGKVSLKLLFSLQLKSIAHHRLPQGQLVHHRLLPALFCLVMITSGQSPTSQRSFANLIDCLSFRMCPIQVCQLSFISTLEFKEDCF
jgi:hypothetical protein